MHIELGSSQVDVQQCVLSWEVGEELSNILGRIGNINKIKIKVKKGEYEGKHKDAN